MTVTMGRFKWGWRIHFKLTQHSWQASVSHWLLAVSVPFHVVLTTELFTTWKPASYRASDPRDHFITSSLLLCPVGHKDQFWYHVQGDCIRVEVREVGPI